jgi:hypothetical protein
MEKDTLHNLRELSTAARRKLAQVRRNKREDSRKPRTHLVSQHLADRRSGIYTTSDAELFIINKILDSDDLAPQDRKTFSQRRRILLKRLTTR